MSDDKTSAEAVPAKAEATPSATPATPAKTYSDEEFKKVIAERDKAKERVRKIEEDEAKAKEAKAIEEGKLKEVLAQKESELASVKQQAEQYQASQAKLREQALSKITDPKLKEIAGKLPNVEDVVEFAEQIATQKVQTFNGHVPTGAGNPLDKITDIRAYTDYLKANGLA